MGDTDWPVFVQDLRVKVVRDTDVYRFDDPTNGIMKHPFEEFELHICMPEDMPQGQCTKNSAPSSGPPSSSSGGIDVTITHGVPTPAPTGSSGSASAPTSSGSSSSAPASAPTSSSSGGGSIILSGLGSREV